jgi:hypothetical protein
MSEYEPAYKPTHQIRLVIAAAISKNAFFIFSEPVGMEIY